MPQRFIARVNEVQRLMARSNRYNWEEMLRHEMTASMLHDKVSAADWGRVQEECVAYALRITGVEIDLDRIMPF